MITKASVGDRRRKGDRRDVRNWIGILNMKATREGQQYFLAALYDIFDGSKKGEDIEEAYRAIADVAARKRREYRDACKDDEGFMIIEPLANGPRSLTNRPPEEG